MTVPAAPFAIFEKPGVYIVGQSALSFGDLERFLVNHDSEWMPIHDDFEHAHNLCETAGRLCYMSFSGKRRDTKDYFRHIIEVGHGSVLEHYSLNFILTGVSRSFTHELVRHRAGWAYSQLSQRYVDSAKAGLVIPPSLLLLPEPERTAEISRLKFVFAQSLERYDKITEMLMERYKRDNPELSATDRRKKARETARSVLPNCTETKIFCTANTRALRHFFFLRGSMAAEIEARRLAVTLFKAVRPFAANLLDDFTVKETPDGIGSLHTTFTKV